MAESVAVDLELRPVPDADWQSKIDRLLRDIWLARKIGRQRRLREHSQYVARYCEELSGEPGLVVDIGPGPGEFLELARAMGHDVLGIDAPDGRGGMGDNYLEYSRLMQQRQGIHVETCGLEGWLFGAHHSSVNGTGVFINSRGSIEQALSQHMLGIPHDEHHRADQMTWSMTAALREIFEQIFEQAGRLLRPGGAFLIHANGATNSREYDRLVLECAKAGPFDLVLHEPPTLHKWRRRAHPWV